MIVDVTLVARLEWLDDAQTASWWADSPDDPGFFAAASSLGELQREAEAAYRWAHEDEDVNFGWEYEDVPNGAYAYISKIEGIADVQFLRSGRFSLGQTLVVIYGIGRPDPVMPDIRSGNRTLVR